MEPRLDESRSRNPGNTGPGGFLREPSLHLQLQTKQNARTHTHLLVLMRNWLETPGWSTSWIAAAKMAAKISRSVKTSCIGRKEGRRRIINTRAYITAKPAVQGEGLVCGQSFHTQACSFRDMPVLVWMMSDHLIKPE